MRQYTNQNQTEILEKLGFPESNSHKEDAPNCDPSVNYAYSIEELISFLDVLPSCGEISIVRANGNWRVAVGKSAWGVCAPELIDVLFMACLRLKEFELI